MQWARGGFIELVTPVRPPTSADRTARIAVMLWTPDAGPLATRDPEKMSFRIYAEELIEAKRKEFRL